ncbi:hypothetical protein LEMLEM_LOCUS13748 [Lemmus lemmus]
MLADCRYQPLRRSETNTQWSFLAGDFTRRRSEGHARIGQKICGSNVSEKRAGERQEKARGREPDECKGHRARTPETSSQFLFCHLLMALFGVDG